MASRKSRHARAVRAVSPVASRSMSRPAQGREHDGRQLGTVQAGQAFLEGAEPVRGRDAAEVRPQWPAGAIAELGDVELVEHAQVRSALGAGDLLPGAGERVHVGLVGSPPEHLPEGIELALSCAPQHLARPGSSTLRACVRPRLVQGITKREDSSMPPTIVLVHGAFADSSNCDVETSCT
jgi:hypothetical protein